MRVQRFFLTLACLLAMGAKSEATVTLVEKDEWKFETRGFVDFGMFYDTTRSLAEFTGSAPVAPSGTLAGDNGRTVFGMRNSHLGFTLHAPEQHGWKTRAHFEFDFIGAGPVPAGQSENLVYASTPVRLHHGFMQGEKDGLMVLIGHQWTLFGWLPKYMLSTVSTFPNPGVLNQRTPQVMAIKTMNMGEVNKLQVGAAIARPTQRDSKIPNLDVGARYIFGQRKAGYAMTLGELTAEPMNIAISGTLRHFATPETAAANAAMDMTRGGAVAVNTMIPIIASPDGKETGRTLMFVGEYSTGRGYGDAFPQWTGGIAQMTAGSGATGKAGFTNLDAGIGGYNTTSDNFDLIDLQSFTVQLQYQFANSRCRVTAGYGEIQSGNNAEMRTTAAFTAAGGPYDKVSAYFVNYMHDFTKQIRVGVEYGFYNTDYTNGTTGDNRRYQIGANFRF